MYVLWGAYHGILLVVHKAMRRVWRLPDILVGNPVIRFVNMSVTFALVVIGFTIFRASSLETVGEMATQILTSFHLEVASQFITSYMLIVIAMAAGLILHFAPHSLSVQTEKLYCNMGVVGQAIVLALILFVVIQARGSELVPFVYLQY